MKNNASNLSIIQAITQELRAHAVQLLPVLTATFAKLGYSEISHQRISQHNNSQSDNNLITQYNSTSCRGLTRARHAQFENVMIKWQLISNNNKEISDLNNEVNILNTLNTLQSSQKNAAPIAPPILAYKDLDLKILEQSYQLTILVMPYYSLGSLAQQLSSKSRQPLTDKQKPQIILQSAYLIANLHKQHWLHNDIKPSNFLVCAELFDNNPIKIDSLLLTDFALAERCDKNFKQEYAINPAGTPAYIAPERWQGQAATLQSDIYAFGIILYEVLVGTRPFNIEPQSNEPLKQWALKHCQQPVPALPRRYSHYQTIINKALAKRVERRYQSMEEILGDLELF